MAEPPLPQADGSQRGASAGAARASGRRRRAGRARHVAGLLVLLTMVGLILLFQGGGARWIVLPSLESVLGCDAGARRVRMWPGGSIVLRDLQLRVRGIDGPAGLFFETPRAEVRPDWWSLLSGSPRIRTIIVERPVVRLSQDERQRLNVSGLGGAGGGGSLEALPAIEVTEGTIEFGEHGAAWYTPLTSLRVRGRVVRDPSSPGVCTAELVEIRPDGASDALSVEGRFDLRAPSGELRVGHIDLARWQGIDVPRRVRELWRQLAMSGEVSQTVFGYTPSTGVSASFMLRDVEMNIPLPAEPVDELWGMSEDSEPARAGPPPPSTGPLQMRDVSGSVRFEGESLAADLSGRIGDLACAVTLRTQGLSLESPLEARIVAQGFKVGGRPRLLPYAPYFVKRQFKRFTGPTAIVDGQIELRRGPPEATGPAPLAVSGRLAFTQGTAEFEKFRYPFANMKGLITFDESGVDLVEITGEGATGARLRATGRIAPPTYGAAVDLNINVTSVPTDHILRAAMPEKRRVILDALFNESAYQGLVDAGLVRPSAGASAHPGAPVFDLGGTAEIRVGILREEGPDSEYHTSINVEVPRAGLVAKPFPYPVLAHGLSISVDETHARASARRLEGLTGSGGSLSTVIVIGASTGTDTGGFELEVDARGVPVDRFLLHAIPGAGGVEDAGDAEGAAVGDAGGLAGAGTDGRDEDALPWSPRALVEGFALTGALDAKARVWSRGDDDPTSYTVDVLFDDLVSRPGPGGLTLGGLDGTLRVSDSTVEIRELRGEIGAGTFSVSFRGDGLGPSSPAPPTYSARLEAQDVDLALPIEHAVRVLSTTSAEAIRGLRERYAPAGLTNATLSLAGGESGVQYQLGLESFRGAELTIEGERLSLDEAQGRVMVSPVVVECQGLRARVLAEGHDAGTLALDGRWPIAPEGDADLSIDLEGARLDSAATRAAAGRIDERLAQWLESSQVSGEFSLSGRAVGAPGQRPRLTGELRPRSFAMTRGASSLSFEDVSGRLTFDGEEGRVEHLVVCAPGWSFAADGRWGAAPTPWADLRLSLAASALTDDLALVFPEAARQVLSAASFSVRGPVRVPEATLLITPSPVGEGSEARFRADVRFDDAKLDFVLPFEEISGSAQIGVVMPIEGGEPTLDLGLRADRFRAAGVPMTDGRLRLVSGDRPGLYSMPVYQAQVHGGTIVARGVLWPGGGSEPAPGGAEASARTDRARAVGNGRFEASVRASGIDFAELMRDLAARGVPVGEGAGAGAASGSDTSRALSGSRGQLDADLSVAGAVDDPASRRGRGLLRVSGGEVVTLPGVVGLLRLSNLQPPIGERLDFASARFYLEGQTITFDSIEASSKSLTIAGAGTMQWPGQDVNLRFNSRGRGGIPLLSDLFVGLRDELITTMVTGNLPNLEYRVVQLPATRRMLGTIFRAQPQPPAPATPGAPARAVEEPDR